MNTSPKNIKNTLGWVKWLYLRWKLCTVVDTLPGRCVGLKKEFENSGLLLKMTQCCNFYSLLRENREFNSHSCWMNLLKTQYNLMNTDFWEIFNFKCLLKVQKFAQFDMVFFCKSWWRKGGKSTGRQSTQGSICSTIELTPNR